MSVDNIVFDFGGVLFDWNPRYLYRKIFDDEKQIDYFLTVVCPPEWNIQMDAGKPFAQACEERKKLFPLYAAEIDAYNARWIEMFGEPLYETHEIVKKAAEKYNVYGLTNWSAEKFPDFKKRYGVFDYMKGIVVSGQEKCVKPDAEIYRRLTDRYELNPEKTLFIDDNQINVDGAKACGWRGVLFENPASLRRRLSELGVTV